MIDRGAILDERSVIVVPDPAVIPALVHHALSLVGDDYNISIGYPLRRTPVLGFLSSLMDLVETERDGKVETSEYFRFIQHPYVRNILLKGRVHTSRILFHMVEESIRTGEAGSFITLEEIEGRDSHVVAAARAMEDEAVTPEILRAHLRTVHHELIRPLLGVTSVGQCVQGCVRILTFVANQSTSRQHLFFRPYVEALIEALVHLSGSLLSAEHLQTPESVFRILRRYLGEEKVALPGTPVKGIQVLGLLETRNLKFDHVFVLGAVDDLIPGQSGRYTIVPDFARKQLGIPTLRDHDQTAAYHFHLLVSGAREVHFFFTESDGAGASRFVEKLLWNQEKTFAPPRNLISRISYRIDLPHSHPEAIRKAPGLQALLKTLRFSATALDTYLKCGLRFYYRYVLRLQERDEPVGDIDRAGLGRFVHAVLAQYYKPFVGKTINGSELDKNSLMRVVDALFLETFGKEEPGNQFLLKTQVRHQLENFLDNFEIPRLSIAPAEIVDVEKEISVHRDGVELWGRIDRIEKRGEEVQIYDFKTGGDRSKLKIRFGKLDRGDSSTWSEAIGSLQLPLYSMLYRGLPGAEKATLRPYYILLGRSKLDHEAMLPLFEDGTDASRFEGTLEEIVMGLVAEITDESKPFMPPERLDKQCPSCPFVRICGTEWVKKKRW
jgi:CRISPR/Cas system-associated exonuclease Cas4 (RecB family)